jgi:hypothetical protein
MKFIILTIALFISIISSGQVHVKGLTLDHKRNILPGCYINEIGRVNSTQSDKNGQFSIQVQNDSSKIEFSFVGTKTLIIKVDSINRDSYNAILNLDEKAEFIVYAPGPPYIEIGYRGLIQNQPWGIHLDYSTWGDRFRSHLDINTIDLTNYFYSFEIGPYRFGRSKLFNYFNPYLKGLILQSNSDLFLCNRFYIMRNIVLNIGAGNDRRENSHDNLIFLTGIKTFINLPLPILTNYFSLDFFYNQNHIDWISSFYTELYNKNYRNLSIGIGYQKYFNQKDIILNLNYKYYFIKR